MESCLFGLQLEASSRIAHCLISRACHSEERVKWAAESTHLRNYVYLKLVGRYVLSKKIVTGPSAYTQSCHSDRLLEGRAIDRHLARDLP